MNDKREFWQQILLETPVKPLTEFERSLCTPDAEVSLTAPCPHCKGTGRTEEMFRQCRECGRNYTGAEHDAELRAAKDVQPCGHPWRFHEENDWCAECEGTGRLRGYVPVAALLEALGVVRERTNS